MSKRSFLFALPLIFFLVSLHPGRTGLEIGDKMPKADVLMNDISGKMVSLGSASTTKGLLVMFSSNTCPWVIRNQQRTRSICQYALQNGFGVILLNSNEGSRDREDSFEAMKDYAKNQQYQWYYAVDKNHELADAFGADRTPECFLFNKESILVYHGAIDDNPSNARGVRKEHLKNAIDEMMEGKLVSVSFSRSVGCSIKRIRE